jgi:hypothetical protein
MSTVYQRICEFEKRHWFRFNQQGMLHVGVEIKREFLKIYQGHLLPIVDSIEPGGTFKVFDYPDFYTSRMDEKIADYVTRVVTPKTKRIVEKPAYPEPKEKPTRTRKRIPINKPAYSGNYSKK